MTDLDALLAQLAHTAPANPRKPRHKRLATAELEL